jgi:hypothetical protein
MLEAGGGKRREPKPKPTRVCNSSTARIEMGASAAGWGQNDMNCPLPGRGRQRGRLPSPPCTYQSQAPNHTEGGGRDETMSRADIKLKPYAHAAGATDAVAKREAREQFQLEMFVAKERVKIAREAVKQCYYQEGVNHYQNCREEVQTYLNLIWKKNYGALEPPSGDE